MTTNQASFKTSAQNVHQFIKELKIDFVVSVPDKYIDELLHVIRKDPAVTYLPVPREEEGLGILAGAFMAGKKPAIILQNSGLGNSINAICSLLNYYQIPVLFLISNRGQRLEKIDAQKVLGTKTNRILETVDMEFAEVHPGDDIFDLKDKVGNVLNEGKSFGVLFPLDFWS